MSRILTSLLLASAVCAGAQTHVSWRADGFVDGKFQHSIVITGDMDFDRIAFNAPSFNFRSQFTDTPEGYAQNEEGIWHPTKTKSGFLSPAYTDIALGIQWAPTSWFNVNLAPLTGGLTIVTNPLLRKNYGMKLTKEDLDPAVGRNYNSVLFQFGAQLKTNFKLTFNDNFGYETQLVLFTDYLNEPYVRINWDNAITWKFTKYVNFAFKTWLISDPNVTRTLDDGTTAPLGVQFKSYVSFNFTYSFAK